MAYDEDLPCFSDDGPEPGVVGQHSDCRKIKWQKGAYKS